MRILLPTFHVRQSAQAIPLAAGCLKACLPQSLRDQTRLLDMYAGQDLEDLTAIILDARPEVIAFPLYLWNRTEVLQLCRQLRRRQPEIFLLAGGPEASADSRRVIAEGQLNGVIRGEGEQPFAQLMAALSAGRSGRGIPGYLPADEPDQQFCPVASCSDLTDLPSPWLQGDLPLSEGCGVLWEVARGCRFNCAFCFDAKGEQGVRPFPEARLRAELELFVRRKVSQVWVLDSTFNAPPERGKQLLDMLLSRAPQIHFHLEAKADFLNRETAEMLSRLTCSVQVGLQSTDDEVLKPLHRTFKREKVEQQLQLLSTAGITFGLDLIYGLPGDNHAGFCRSLDFALNQRPNQVDIFPLAVLPGTELYRNQQKFGISADSKPPYLISQNRSYPNEQLAQSCELTAAADIFYNRGRAVGFFHQLCEALSSYPSRLLEDFAHWFCRQPGLDLQQLLASENWQPTDILSLQLAFAVEKLRQAGRENLRSLAEDLIHYHYLCAETLLTADCQPATSLPPAKRWGKTSWQLNPLARVHGFQYDLEELEMLGGEPWDKLVKRLNNNPSYGIFFCQNGQPVVEALQTDFARLLLGSTGQKTAEQLLRGLARDEAEELLQFAVTAGLLMPAI
jgi:radical SAM superfamily enzyme YgiQ (UPF0313 family)